MSYSGLGTRRKGRMARWEVKLPEYLATRIETLMVDPVNKRPVYGARSQLVTELLEKWVTEQEAAIAARQLELGGKSAAQEMLA